MCTLTLATAPPPPGSSASVPRSSATPRKYRDSKISRIQPYVHTETLTAPAIDSYNNLHSEKDSAIKYYHANKFLEKNHAHKKFGFDKKKVSSNHELFKWVFNKFGSNIIETPIHNDVDKLAKWLIQMAFNSIIFFFTILCESLRQLWNEFNLEKTPNQT